MNQHPECSICCNLYTTEGENEPKSLPPCGHTFCAKCIQQIKPKKCPNCNKQFTKVTTNFGLRDSLPHQNKKLTVVDEEQQQPQLKKYKSSNMSIEELQQELELRQRDEAQTKLISIRESLSIVVVAINKRNKDIATIDGNIIQVEDTLKVLKEKRVNENKQLKELQLKEIHLKSEEKKLISLINKHHPVSASSSNNNGNNYSIYFNILS